MLDVMKPDIPLLCDRMSDHERSTIFQPKCIGDDCLRKDQEPALPIIDYLQIYHEKLIGKQ
jgi:hypothetical protein